jgi:hypothetical protein
MKKIFNALFSIMLLLVSVLDALPEGAVSINKCASNRSDKRKCELAICCMFKDEAPYLIEWIEYHRLLGVEHFYLYNNNSHDDFWSGTLKKYVKKGVVELFDVPFDSSIYNDGAVTHNAVQVTCYNHAINLAKRNNKWLAIIDADEFICPVSETDLRKVLRNYDDASALAVYWQIYGTSNIWNLAPGELMIEKLLYRQPNNGGNGLFKSIVKPELVECVDPHYCRALSGYILNQNRQIFSHTPQFASIPADIIRINHYTFRTEWYYYNVKKPRKLLWGYSPSPEEERAELDFANIEYDPVMLRFVSDLKKKLKKERGPGKKSCNYSEIPFVEDI